MLEIRWWWWWGAWGGVLGIRWWWWWWWGVQHGILEAVSGVCFNVHKTIPVVF